MPNSRGKKRTSNGGRTTSKKKAKSTSAMLERMEKSRKRKKGLRANNPSSDTSPHNNDSNASKSDKKRPFVADPSSVTNNDKSSKRDLESHTNVRVPDVDIMDQVSHSKRSFFTSQDNMSKEEVELREQSAIKIQQTVRAHITRRLVQDSLELIEKSRPKLYACGKCANCKKSKSGQCDNCSDSPKPYCEDHRCSKKVRIRLSEVLQLTNHPRIFHGHMEKYYKKECSSPCHNCHRERIVDFTGASKCYDFDMYLVPSYFLKPLQKSIQGCKEHSKLCIKRVV